MNRQNDITNAMDLRIHNTKKIVRLISEKDTITRNDLADQLELSSPTVSLITKVLLNKNLIVETGTVKSSGGRKPVLIRMNADSGYAVGVAVTKHVTRLVIMNISGEVVYSIKSENSDTVFSDSDEYWRHVGTQVDNAITASCVGNDRIVGVTLGLPGMVEGDLLSHVSILPKKSLDLKRVRELLGRPVWIMGDAVLAAKSCIRKRADFRDGIFLLLNRTIGGALISHEDKTRTSIRYCDVAHLTLNPKSSCVCDCGKEGCFQACCSPGRIIEAIIDSERRTTSIGDFLAAMEAGDLGYSQMWQAYLDDLAMAVHDLRMVLNCDVIIGGVMSGFLKHYEKELIEKVDRLDPFGETAEYLAFCEYDGFEAAAGAALEAIERYLVSVISATE